MIPRTAEQLVELLDKLVTEGDLGYREAAGPPVDLDPVVEQRPSGPRVAR